MRLAIVRLHSSAADRHSSSRGPKARAGGPLTPCQAYISRERGRTGGTLTEIFATNQYYLRLVRLGAQLAKRAPYLTNKRYMRRARESGPGSRHSNRHSWKCTRTRTHTRSSRYGTSL